MKSATRPAPPAWHTGARLCLYLAAFASAVWLLIPFSKSSVIMRYLEGGDPMEFLGEPWQKSNRHDPATRLLVFGDHEPDDPAASWRALWMSAPENPAFFSRYLAMHLAYDEGLTPDLLADAERIDPGNGFWHIIAACIDADDSLERIRNESDDGSRIPDTWIANDEEDVLRRIDLLHHAASMPELNSRQADWYRAAAPHMLPAQSLAELIETILWLSSEIIYGSVNMRKLSHLQQAAIRIAIDREDPELAARIIRDWHRIAVAYTHNGHTLIDMMLAHLIVHDSIEILHEAATQLDLAQELIWLTPILNQARENQAAREERRAIPGGLSNMHREHQQTSLLGTVAMDLGPDMLLDRPDPFTPADHRPILRMEHAFFERLLIPPIALAVCLVLFISAIAWFTTNRRKRRLARKILHLPPRRRLIGMAVIACAAPWLAYGLITRATPYGWHAWSLDHGIASLIAQWTLLLFLTLTLPALLAPVLFERRAKHAHSRWPGGSKIRLATILITLLAIPASGWMLPTDATIHAAFAWIPGAFAILATTALILFSVWMHHKHPWRTSPHRLAASLFATHTRIAALIALAAWTAFTHHEEKTWAARDTLFAFDPNQHALSSNEAIVSERLRAQTLRTLEAQPTQ